MKTIKQSRLDRLARRKIRSERIKEAEKNLTKNDIIKRDNALLKRIEKACLKEGFKRCPHGLPFSGYECFVCRSDEIANRLREEWRPADVYNLEVIPVNSEGMYIPITVRTNTITKTLKDMQENGFWYGIHTDPMFLMPQSIRCIIVKGIAQNPGYTDPPVKPDSKVPERTRSSRR